MFVGYQCLALQKYSPGKLPFFSLFFILEWVLHVLFLYMRKQGQIPHQTTIYLVVETSHSPPVEFYLWWSYLRQMNPLYIRLQDNNLSESSASPHSCLCLPHQGPLQKGNVCTEDPSCTGCCTMSCTATRITRWRKHEALSLSDCSFRKPKAV